ncbi:MAG: sugar phosphate isomerase/epimerase [Blastocatellia bacterium]|nr:sugar phosphate isomerase/epimerase [Blastocatellia bacterium]
MKPGIVADEINRNFRDAVRIGAQAGLRQYEIRFLTTGRAPMCDREELLEIERIRDGEGLAITALSPGLFKWTRDVEAFRREMDEIFPRAVEWAHRWGLLSLIVFGFCKPGATEENADTISSDDPPSWVGDALAEAAARAAAENLRLLIEPEPVCWCDTGTATARLIARAQSASLGINYDPCNVAWQLRRDPIDEFEANAPYIQNVHIKDQLDAPVGSGMPTWVVPGEGMLDLRAHLGALKRMGYAGPISLEPHFPLTVDSLTRCREVVEQFWSEA